MNLVGRKIVEVRPMTKEERVKEGWDRGTMTIVLDDGSVLYASRDEEGNGPGEIFGVNKDRHFGLMSN